MFEGLIINLLSSAIWQNLSVSDFPSEMEITYLRAIEKYAKGNDTNRKLILKEFPKICFCNERPLIEKSIRP